jgi:putative phosphoribosyl transferase
MRTRQPFTDRRDAGKALASTLVSRYGGYGGVIVLALPRGGVPVAYEVALALRAPLDVWTVRKIGVPSHRELALGAIAADGTFVVDEDLASLLRVPERAIEAVIKEELAELRRREELYRDERPRPRLEGRTVIVVDDGLATGSSMYAAVTSIRKHAPAKIVVAVPVGSKDGCEALRTVADDVVCLLKPAPFNAVGKHYEAFGETSDGEVRGLLEDVAKRSAQWRAA